MNREIRRDHIAPAVKNYIYNKKIHIINNYNIIYCVSGKWHNEVNGIYEGPPVPEEKISPTPSFLSAYHYEIRTFITMADPRLDFFFFLWGREAKTCTVLHILIGVNCSGGDQGKDMPFLGNYVTMNTYYVVAG